MGNTDMPKKSFKEMFDDVLRARDTWKSNQRRHKCIRKQVGVVRKLTGRSGQPLKRPVVVARFYECAICWREMK
jgi:hypothetical protein